MKKVEILAPVGSIESFYAAIEGGADAVYLAGKLFGARAFADNFNKDELVFLINYAHSYGVKVYVTCNILILEREVESFLDYVEFLHKNNVDAIIMQDIGMIDLVHKTFPNLEIHASTQMHIHNLEGAMILEELGIKRVVLARETPLSVVKEIKEKTNLEIEVFVHGALCASYSGMCLFARSIGKRSGNRGTCSGCCRLKYSLESENETLEKDKYPLSMKDLMTLYDIDKLVEIGIDSFKIEGRMKGASYVYFATKLYKETTTNYLKTREIKVNEEDLFKLNNVFNRTYTKGFMLGDEDVINNKSPNNQGVLIGIVTKSSNNFIDIKLKEDISIHDGLRITNTNFEYGLILNNFKIKDKQVHFAKKKDTITLKVNKNIPLGSKVLRTSSYIISEEVKNIITNKKRKIPITVSCFILKDKPLTIKVSDGTNEVIKEDIIPLNANNRSLTKDEIKEKLLKIQNTIYFVKDLKIELDADLFIPISSLNNLKREVLDLLTIKRIARFEKDFQKEKYQREVPSFERETGYTLYTNNKKDINSKYKYIYSETLPEEILKLPKVMPTYSMIDKTKEYLVGELGALKYLKNIITDFSFNVTNSYTVAFLHSMGAKRITLSVELDDVDIKELIDDYQNRYKKSPNLELIIKTNLEVMVLKYRFSKDYSNLKYLVDRFKNKYHIIEKNNLTYIYDYKVTERKNSDYYFTIGVNYLRIENNLL